MPFVKADATRFSETGYVGANVDDIIRDLVAQADGDIEKAKFGIVYLDEADKIATRSGGGNRDVNSRGVQFGLLRLMEECDVDLKSGNDMQSQMQALMDMQSGNKKSSKINTRHILFIVSGAFSGLDEIISKRLHQNPVGFHRNGPEASSYALASQASTEDFIDYGYEAEFIGRLPIRVSCEPLEAKDLEEILSCSKGSIIKQYKKAFASYGIKLEIQDDAIAAIAQKAASERTGARALMTVCEQVLRHYKFELPSSGIEQFTLTASMVNDPKTELSMLLNSITAMDAEEHAEKADLERKFFESHKKKLALSSDFRSRLVKENQSSGADVTAFLNKTFTGYEHGLLLLKQALGKKVFQIDAAALDDPKSYLEKLVVNHYENQSTANT